MAAVTITSVNVLVRSGCAPPRRHSASPPASHPPQDNPSVYTNPLQFEVQYECLFPLANGAFPRERALRFPTPPSARTCRALHVAPARSVAGLLRAHAPHPPAPPAPPRADLEWKVTYVGSAEDSRHDQVLESVLVGPVAVGPYRFVLQARARAGPAGEGGRRLTESCLRRRQTRPTGSSSRRTTSWASPSCSSPAATAPTSSSASATTSTTSTTTPR